ncbi:MetQ/NlpA family ABC transporter substrate-binding protein [Saccharibacillus sp. CPCC 101409]|uniref:MetQ/NlpA family ABC transporter substrate-binding protein n=1 Tax=Saccharibacillus sp. CPCC 101409 TaxID=3058041 RepID=UPI0026724B9E|nr:MetQ/NlpA family ABC transporter substrate-binding protein [Saccharibacillus sp. CPCC 101409]MDO3408229.1 MetQ/NlpA family ABC transporter substrate-binding protein [Saccharibacillus sp. CPCC 101409]
MKKYLFIVLAALIVILSGCGQSSSTPAAPSDSGTANKTDGADSGDTKELTKLKVASLPAPMDAILLLVKPLLVEDGIDLEIVEMSDNIQPNDALAHKEVDANFFQHVPYAEAYNEAHDSDIVPVQPVYNALYAGYSKKYKSVDDLPDGAIVAIPNDPPNIAHSLLLLEQNDLIELKEGVGIKATLQDITSNPKNLDFKEVDLLTLNRMMDDADMVTMYPAYAKPLGLSAKKDALIVEKDMQAFAITLMAREDNKDDPAIQKLAERMRGPEVEKFLEEEYTDTYPAF